MSLLKNVSDAEFRDIGWRLFDDDAGRVLATGARMRYLPMQCMPALRAVHVHELGRSGATSNGGL